MIDWKDLRLRYNLFSNTQYKTTDSFLLGLYLRVGSEKGVMSVLQISNGSSFKRKLQRAKSQMASKLEKGGF